MCLITNQLVPTKTTKDITVYKQMSIREYDNKILSHIRNYEYKLNKLYKVRMSKSKIGNYSNYSSQEHYRDYTKPYRTIDYNGSNRIIIDKSYTFIQKGFHFYTKLALADTIHTGIVECIIPKNSLVYYDEVGQGVSNRIIITKIIKRK